MNNMGGFNRLYYIDADNFSALSLNGNGLYDLTLDEGKSPVEIAFTPGSGKLSESEAPGDQGTLYNFEVSCKVPKCGNDNRDLLGAYRKKKILILAEDENENLWLAGDPGSYFDINVTGDTGAGQADYNGRGLKISASLAKGSVFINPLA
jgi:hypothetical protein